jgi:hypothetical protein
MNALDQPAKDVAAEECLYQALSRSDEYKRRSDIAAGARRASQAARA